MTFVITCNNDDFVCINHDCNIISSLSLGVNLRAAVTKCVKQYLTYGLDKPSALSEKARKRILHDWLAP
jgi:hypothetical protein